MGVWERDVQMHTHGFLLFQAVLQVMMRGTVLIAQQQATTVNTTAPATVKTIAHDSKQHAMRWIAI